MRTTVLSFTKLLCAACVASLLLGSTAFAAARTGSQGARGRGDTQTRAAGAPEIDPGLAAAGLVVLVAGTLVLTGRRRPATD